MEHKRNCPNCGIAINYSCYRSWYHGNKSNTSCRRCGRKKQIITDVARHAMSVAAKLRWSNSEERNKQKGRITGKKFGKRPEWWCNKIHNAKLGHSVSSKTRKKLRLARIEQISREKYNGGQVFPSYNPNACILIEEYGQKHGYNFQHAMNGGEFLVRGLGYWVDGYDKEQNVVIEVDEPFHKNRTERDVRRQQEIENHLGCKFVRIKIRE